MLIEARVHWRAALGIIVAVAVSVAVAFVISGRGTKMYTAESRLVVTAGLGLTGTGVDLTMAPSVGQSYAELATTRPVLLDVIDRTQLPYDAEELGSRVRVMANPIVPFLTVSMTDEVPERAARVANALAEILVERATIPASGVGAGAEPAKNLLEIVELATEPQTASSPRVMYDTAMAGAATLVTMLALVAALTYVRNERRISRKANE